MTFKKFRRITCVVALSAMALTVPMLSGCNTDHPEAEITIEYNGVTYVLEYKMYRNMYPQTVQHFIELADNGFYDNTIVHNYQYSSYIYCGGYNYNGGEKSYEEAYEGGSDDLYDYMNAVSKEKQYKDLADPAKGIITPSVYRDLQNGSYTGALDTLIGEFSNNQHKIESGALTQSFGALRMFYTSKPNDVIKNKRVYMDKEGSPQGVMGEYKYNSATSLFSIQLGTYTSTDSNYCIFAQLQNTEVLEDFKEAVRSSSSKSVTLYVDNYDEFMGENVNQATYSLTEKPIIIRSVKITKY